MVKHFDFHLNAAILRPTVQKRRNIVHKGLNMKENILKWIKIASRPRLHSQNMSFPMKKDFPKLIWWKNSITLKIAWCSSHPYFYRKFVKILGYHEFGACTWKDFLMKRIWLSWWMSAMHCMLKGDIWKSKRRVIFLCPWLEWDVFYFATLLEGNFVLTISNSVVFQHWKTHLLRQESR